MFSGLRNFIVVFLVALLGFGVAGHFLAVEIIPTLIKGDNTSDISVDESSNDELSSDYESTESQPIRESGEQYTFAVLCIDLEEELSCVYFIHTNEGYETCTYTTLSGKLPVENNGAESTLARVYKDNGADFFVNKLNYITGYTVDGFAILDAMDKSGNGRCVTELASSINYTCKISVPFSYPNPNYVDPSLSIDDSSDDTTSEETSVFESSIDETSTEETSAPDTNSEFIMVPVGDYALNGFFPLEGQADKLPNYRVLLDSKYNIYANDIYTDILEKIFIINTSENVKVFEYFSTLSANEDMAAKHLFNDYKKYKYEYPQNVNSWDEAIAALRELELGEN